MQNLNSWRLKATNTKHIIGHDPEPFPFTTNLNYMMLFSHFFLAFPSGYFPLFVFRLSQVWEYMNVLQEQYSYAYLIKSEITIASDPVSRKYAK